MLKTLLLPLFIVMAFQGHAAQLVISPEVMQPSSMSLVCDKLDCVDALSKFRQLKEIQPAATPVTLKRRTNLGFFERSFVRKADAVFDRNPAVAMILIEKGEIIHERYHPEVTEKTPLLSYSMSKSLTSMVVGKAHCAGDLKNLDATMKEVVPVLDGTAYGEATIKQLLMMASGAVRGSVFSGGSPYKAGLGNPYDPFIYASTLNQVRKFKDHQLKPDGSVVKAGEEFSYKNLDSQSLAFLFPTVGERSFAHIFEKDVWQDAGAENKGYWVHDKLDVIHTAAGFHGTALDWARVALKILETISSSQNDCFTNYMKAATQTQIKNTGNTMPDDHWIGRSFKGYGYQFWTQNDENSEAIYLNGAFGQRIAISPKKQRIMLVFSYKESYMGELYKLFAGW
ncbi:serine hydrolase domain-containing protein [Limnohabitans sp.]|uniref:serine hydrolase domain-containing protein n=1 Tax=Limnohabitans sp. TaxID=1907725 RepID=UPI002AFEC561|nr:serine hydrolase [Limnohabitans sp.]